MKLSRRAFLGGAGLSVVALGSGCVQQSRKAAEMLGAFPDVPNSSELLGPQKGMAKLNFNENPYGPAPSALKMIEYAGRKGAYYPGKAISTLKAMIAEKHGVDKDQVVLSTGSAEALSAIALVYGQQGPIVAPRLFFDATVLYAQRLGLAEIQRTPLLANMHIDIAALERQVNSKTGLVQVCNPNNPTGLLIDGSVLKPAVKRMAKLAPVVVDEAYMELVDNSEKHSCMDLIREGHNVIVARTFSKLYGMAGIRVGYIIAQPETAKEIQKAVMAWMSGVGIAAAIACYDDQEFIQYSLSKIYQGRQMIESKLDELGLEALPSQTNFVFFKAGKPANDIQAKFLEQKVLIRGQYMDYQDWVRVSVGKIADVEKFCKLLPRVISA